ncbi:MAG TPA: bifunctional riboflavin kinase/FAD synthetase [Gemmatimonadaceae bacterium]|nr:bifunctional riboflavin kinase/FAD synthetase [Gemmatimonadaceae bacterium]
MTHLPPEVTGTVVTVGTFDGVHLGHREVFRRLHARARAAGMKSVLVTFDPHPLEVVNPTVAPRLLTVGDEKLEVLATCELDYVVVLPFTAMLATYSAEQFVKAVLIDRVRMRELLIGHDHGLGRNRAGNVDVLRELARPYGFSLDVIDPVGLDDRHPFSSSVIRRAVAGGDLTRAAKGLGRDYSISGVVERGAGRGRTLGFRTLNLAPVSSRKLLPPEGVYAVRVATPKGAFGGMMNLGPRPTFNDPIPKVEAHLFDVDIDLYDAGVRVELVERLRETRKFESKEALMAQLERDERNARSVLLQRS